MLVGVELTTDADGQGVARRLIELPGDGLVGRGRLLWVGDDVGDVEYVQVVARHTHRHRALESALLLYLDLDRRADARTARPRVAHLELVATGLGRRRARAAPEEVQSTEDQEGGDEQHAEPAPGAGPSHFAVGDPARRADGVPPAVDRRRHLGTRLLAVERSQDLRAVAFPPLRPASFFCCVVPPCLELLRELLPEPDFFPPRLEAPGELAILAARCLDMPLSLRASYCFSFLTFALFEGMASTSCYVPCL